MDLDRYVLPQLTLCPVFPMQKSFQNLYPLRSLCVMSDVSIPCVSLSNNDKLNTHPSVKQESWTVCVSASRSPGRKANVKRKFKYKSKAGPGRTVGSRLAKLWYVMVEDVDVNQIHFDQCLFSSLSLYITINDSRTHTIEEHWSELSE
jgi:hypothetical protein